MSGQEDIIASALYQHGYKLIDEADTKPKKLLHHPKYENFGNALEIYEDGRNINETVRDFSRLENIPLSIELGKVLKRNLDGSVKRYVFGHAQITLEAATLIASATVSPNPNISDEERERLAKEAIQRREEGQKIAIINRLAFSLESPYVLQVMELLSIENPTGADLGNIVDLVRDACNGDLSPLTSGNELKRFERSINHQEALGLKARHVTSKEQLPTKPMELKEAISFAHRIGNAWLARIEKRM